MSQRELHIKNDRRSNEVYKRREDEHLNDEKKIAEHNEAPVRDASIATTYKIEHAAHRRAGVLVFEHARGAELPPYIGMLRADNPQGNRAHHEQHDQCDDTKQVERVLAHGVTV